jgi:hypothetical protein
MIRSRLLFVVGFLAASPLQAADEPSPLLDEGYRQMYNLQFDEAHKTFAEWKRLRPDDPLGPVSNAAAYLFAEFDRLRILQSEFFVRDDNFRHSRSLTPDSASRQAFDKELEKSLALGNAVLERSPQNTNALFAKILALGLRADYDALIDKRYLTSLAGMKDSRTTAERLLSIDPSFYDAYLAVGVENYLLSLKPAPLRWLLQLGGAQADRDRGLENLRLTAEKGRYLRPYARLLIAVAALRDQNKGQARDILRDLVRQFPLNRLYSEELGRLQ